MKSFWLAKVMIRLESALGMGKRCFRMLQTLEIRTAPPLCYPLAELRFKLVEHQVRVGFGNSALVLQIVAQDDVEEGEVGRRPVGKVRDDHAVWRLAVEEKRPHLVHRGARVG